MYQIPNVIEPLPDELFISYLKRLAAINGVSTVDLLHCYTLVPVSTKNASKYIHYDYCNDTEALLTALGEPQPLISFIEKTSILPALYPFISRITQDIYIHSMLNHRKLIAKAYSPLDSIHYCPMCQSEDDSTYGYPYPHRIHCIPGILCCPKHHVPLIDAKTNQPLIDHVASFDVKVAHFALDALNNWAPLNYETIHSTMLPLYREKITSGKTGLVDVPGFTNYCNVDPSIASNQMRPNYKYTPAQALMAIAALLYDDFHTFQKAVFTPPTFQTPDDYEVLEQDPRISKYRCKSCGNVFYDTPHAITDGWMCPDCAAQLSDHEYFAHITKISTDGHYELQSAISGMMDTISILHHDCGKTLNVRARSFLFEGTRCACERSGSFASIDKSLPEGYKLITFHDTKSKYITVKALKCGHQFEVSWRKMLDFPKCRVCQQQYESEDGFKQSIKELTNDEYCLLSEYKNRTTHVILRHKFCGYSFSIAPKHFLSGQRCPICTKMAKETDFGKVLQYVLTSIDRSKVFSSKDVLVTDVPHSTIKHALAFLVKENLLQKASTRTYEFVNKEETS